MTKLTTITETAQMLALKESTLRKWILQRRMPFVRLGGRAIRIPIAWIEEQVKLGYCEPIDLQSIRSNDPSSRPPLR